MLKRVHIVASALRLVLHLDAVEIGRRLINLAYYVTVSIKAIFTNKHRIAYENKCCHTTFTLNVLFV